LISRSGLASARERLLSSYDTYYILTETGAGAKEREKKKRKTGGLPSHYKQQTLTYGDRFNQHHIDKQIDGTKH